MPQWPGCQRLEGGSGPAQQGPRTLQGTSGVFAVTPLSPPSNMTAMLTDLSSMATSVGSVEGHQYRARLFPILMTSGKQTASIFFPDNV